MRDLTEASAFTTPITVPENADPAQRETSDPPLQALANRTTYLKDEIDGRFDGTGEVLFPGGAITFIDLIGPPSGTPSNASQWSLFATSWSSGADGALLFYDLTPLLPKNASIRRVRLMVAPGRARGSGSRVSITLDRQSYGVSYASPSFSTTTIASEEDDGTTNQQWITIDLTGSPESVGAYRWILTVTAGDDGGAHDPDSILGVDVEMSDDGLRVA